MRINPLVLLFLVSLSLNGLFGYLSYSFYSQKRVAQTALISCQELNVSLEKSIQKQEKEKEATDALISEYQQKQQEIHKKQCKVVEQITLLPPNQKGQDNNEVDIDASLPDGLVRVLRMHYDSLQAPNSGNATKSTD